MAPVLPTQKERIFKVISPLDEDALLFRRMYTREDLGRLFEFELDLLSTDPNIAFEDVLGQGLAVEIERPDGEDRYFHGIVSRFSYVGNEGQFAMYRATVKPWLWLLTRTTDCRVFQNMTVPDILEEVFNHYGFSDFEDHLSRDYTAREYCIQYRESAFDFVSRLMEHEGIYYYFVHEADKHTLILADENSFHEPCPGYDTLRFFPSEEFDRRDLDDDHVYDWQIGQQVQSGRYALNDYNFESPKANLEVRSAFPREHAHAEFEVYDYPGTYREVSDGDNYVRNRIEEVQAQHEIATGRHNSVGLISGYLFNLTGHTRDDQNREYLVISADYSFYSNSYEPESSTSLEPPFACRFSAMDNRQPFRPARVTPKPIVHGMQSAIVTGPQGGEIHTDKYGRVKVHFYWDRHGSEDDNSSCWVRVSQNRAGKEWGEVYLPHVGQEVLVSFEEGDPDRPIVTGRVYNNDNMPPLDLPGDKTQLITRDQGGNETLMEGCDGQQRVTVFSPFANTQINLGFGFGVTEGYQLDTDANQTEKVGGDRTVQIDGDSNETIAGDSEEEVQGNFNKAVLCDTDELYIGHKAKTSISSEIGLNLSNKLSYTIGAEESFFHGFKFSLSTALKYTISKDKEINKKADESTDIIGFWKVKAGKGIVFDSPQDLKADTRQIELRGRQKLTLKVGNSTVEVKKKKITLTSKKIEMKGNVKMTKNLKVDGKIDDK